MLGPMPYSMASYLRLTLIVLLALSLLALLEHRYQILSRFLSRKSTALNLAVTRIAVLLALFNEVDIEKILTFARLDSALLFPPKGWHLLAAVFPRSPQVVHAAYAAFLVSATLALIGLFGRWALAATALSAFYLLTIPQLFGKVDHYHHLVIFCFLLALYPSCDTLSLDAIRKGFRLADQGVLPRTIASTAYAGGLNAIVILMGLMYFFPGTWKVAGSWPHWFSSQNMEYLLYKRMLELRPTALQLMALRMPFAMLLSTYAAVCFELGMIFLILSERLRPLAVIMGLTFHNLTRLLMAIPFLALQFCYAALVDWTKLLQSVAIRLRLRPITVVYDAHCKLCRRTVALLSNLDWLDTLELLPNTQLDELKNRTDIGAIQRPTGMMFAVLSSGGELALGYDGYKMISSHIVLLWPVRLLMTTKLIDRLGRAIYDRVAFSRTCNILDKTAEARELAFGAIVTPGARVVSSSLVGAMFMLGVAHAVNCWPLACYPTFDGPFTLSLSKLTLQTVIGAKVISNYTLSYDQRMADLLGSGRWDGLVQQELRQKAVTRASSAALIGLWLREHSVPRPDSAVLFIDNYSLNLRTLTLRLVGRSELATLSAGDGL